MPIVAAVDDVRVTFALLVQAWCRAPQSMTEQG
jgi:hypothetical protein